MSGKARNRRLKKANYDATSDAISRAFWFADPCAHCQQSDQCLNVSLIKLRVCVCNSQPEESSSSPGLLTLWAYFFFLPRPANFVFRVLPKQTNSFQTNSKKNKKKSPNRALTQYKIGIRTSELPIGSHRRIREAKPNLLSK